MSLYFGYPYRYETIPDYLYDSCHYPLLSQIFFRLEGSGIKIWNKNRKSYWIVVHCANGYCGMMYTVDGYPPLSSNKGWYVLTSWWKDCWILSSKFTGSHHGVQVQSWSVLLSNIHVISLEAKPLRTRELLRICAFCTWVIRQRNAWEWVQTSNP